MMPARRAERIDASEDVFAISIGMRHYGPMNANWRGGGICVCVGCGVAFKSYQKHRKYCSRRCYSDTRVITPELRQKYSDAGKRGGRIYRERLGRKCICKKCGVSFRSGTRRLYCDAHRADAKSFGQKQRNAEIIQLFNRQCQQCGAGFHAHQKSLQKYCSYPCFIESGGALRAGLAAGRAALMYGHKKDANHKDIIEILRKTSTPFIDLSALGYGVPDLVVQVDKKLELWEIKNLKTGYGKRGLNKNQIAFANGWKGNEIRIITTVDEALAAVGAL